MAEQQEPKAVAQIRKQLLDVLNANVNTANILRDSLCNAAQRRQHFLAKGEWDGDVFNLKEIGKAWTRAAHVKDLSDAIKTTEAPGVSGDLTVSALQGDWLATQERAFRIRHQSPVRLAVHAASRKYGHGHPAGLFKKGILSYLQGIIKQNHDR